MKTPNKSENKNNGRPLKEITNEQEKNMNNLLGSLMEIIVPNNFPSVIIGTTPQ